MDWTKIMDIIPFLICESVSFSYVSDFIYQKKALCRRICWQKFYSCIDYNDIQVLTYQKNPSNWQRQKEDGEEKVVLKSVVS